MSAGSGSHALRKRILWTVRLMSHRDVNSGAPTINPNGKGADAWTSTQSQKSRRSLSTATEIRCPCSSKHSTFIRVYRPRAWQTTLAMSAALVQGPQRRASIAARCSPVANILYEALEKLSGSFLGSRLDEPYS